MDAEFKKLGDEIKEAFLVENLGMLWQGPYKCVNNLEDYHDELVSLFPWLGPHITKQSIQGSTLQVVMCIVPITITEDRDSL